MMPIEQLLKELWEATEADLLERVRWLDRDLWSQAVTADPALGQRYREAKDNSIKRKDAELRQAEEPILKDLRLAGIEVTSVWHLGGDSQRFDAGIPVLLAHAEKDYPDSIREGIYSSLGRRWARDLAWDEVLRTYIAEPNKSDIAGPSEIGAPNEPKTGMARALSGMATPADLPVLAGLISDRTNGPTRIFFIVNLTRSRSPLAFETLASLSNDPELKTEIAIRLKGKMRRQAKKEGNRSARN